jgi:mycothiol S-conjugate amidase
MPAAREPSVGDRLALLAVHAHPDDEASKGAATVSKYVAEGVHAVLVTCTGGEAGDILNPAVDTPEIRARLNEVRMEELRNSVGAIGYDRLHLLGYHDSGMPDTEHNDRPDNFANADDDEVVGRLVALIRAERPQVVITYDEGRFYKHPDHLKVHEVSVAAFDAAGDPDRYPEAGPPWQPAKLYYTGFSRRRVEILHHAYLERGEESPFGQWLEGDGFPDDDDRFTTFVDVGERLAVRRAALLAHRTQIDPESHWMRLPDEALREIVPWEEFILARSLVDTGVAPGDVEDDLFAGARGLVEGARASAP